MKPTTLLITPRLILRPVRLSDALTIQKVFPTWRNTRYMSQVPWPYPKDGALVFLRDVALPAVKRGDEWLWAITVKGDDTLKGIVHLRRKHKWNRGFWIVRECQGRGYITEAVRAVNTYAFTVLGFQKLVMTNAKGNGASRRIKQKTGGRLIGYSRDTYTVGMRASEIWVLTREEWEKITSRRAF